MPNRTQIFRLRSKTKHKLTGLCLRFAVATFCLTSALAAHGQASRETAIRNADLQVGGGYANADSDYSPERYRGYFIYGTLDFLKHFGVEAQYAQVNTSNSAGQSNALHMYERTYQIGARYVRQYGRFHPYGRFMVGRGVFNFPNDRANLAYNLYGYGGGVDINTLRHLNVRGDYEFQHWINFNNSSLSPGVITVGAAYHF